MFTETRNQILIASRHHTESGGGRFWQTQNSLLLTLIMAVRLECIVQELKRTNASLIILKNPSLHTGYRASSSETTEAACRAGGGDDENNQTEYNDERSPPE